jgi:hypothetical protein
MLIIIGTILLVALSLNASFAASFNDEKIFINSPIVYDNVTIFEIVNITGVVTDENGNPVGNTLVTVIAEGKIYTVMTDTKGGWILSYQRIRTEIVSSSVLDEIEIYAGFNNYAFSDVNF